MRAAYFNSRNDMTSLKRNTYSVLRAGHMARIGEKRNVQRGLVGKPEGQSHFEDISVGMRTILKWILNMMG